MEIKDFGDFKAPRRHPWLLIALVVLAVIFVILRGSTNDKPQHQEKVVIQTDDLVPGDGEATSHGATTPKPAPVAPANLASVLQEAKDAEKAERLNDARRLYLSLLKLPLNRKTRADVEARVGRIGSLLVQTPHPMPEKVQYTVKSGDSVDRIARRFGTTVELIQKSNEIANPNRIKIGEHLRVLSAKVSVFVSKSRNDLVVNLNGQFFKRYKVGTGKYGRTPTGDFSILERISEPVWWHPNGKEVPFGDPENILGTRWMTLVKGYGIHGTWDRESIGKAESAGCVRMLNEDVEELYRLLPLGTPVTLSE